MKRPVKKNTACVKKSPMPLKAYEDIDFLKMDRSECRAVRLQLELLKPALIMEKCGIESTIVIFGSARTLPPEVAEKRLKEALQASAKKPSDPTLRLQLKKAEHQKEMSRYYEGAQRLGYLITKESQREGHPSQHVVITGGGPGVMEAGNRGAKEAGGLSIGLNISLPYEQSPNPYITPELNFQFHYFSIRKMHFLLKAKALVAMPGGWGTMDELFEGLTLIQTHKIPSMPIVLFGREFWTKIVNWDLFIEAGMIDPSDLKRFQIVDTAEEAWDYIKETWKKMVNPGVVVRRGKTRGPKEI